MIKKQYQAFCRLQSVRIWWKGQWKF